VELIAIDADGVELQVVTWETHEVTAEWEIGATYAIRDGRAKRYIEASGPELHIHRTWILLLSGLQLPQTGYVSSSLAIHTSGIDIEHRI